MEKVFLIHGWSVTSTDTYQALHLQLAKNGFKLEEIFLGRYVSLDDTVEVVDIARAMQYALDEKLGGDYTKPFHMITHSTGALVVRTWITQHYTGQRAEGKGLKNVVFLAPPHFGSRLAHHGKSMLANAVYFGDTGARVLNSLELASEFSFDLNEQWLDPSTWKNKGMRAYSLTSDRVEQGVGSWFKSKIMPANYETGSDMVVRACAGNLNHRRFRIEAVRDGGAFYTSFREIGRVEGVAFGAFSEYTHSGPDNGILNSIKTDSTPANHKSFRYILQCLRVQSDADYEKVRAALADETKKSRELLRKERDKEVSSAYAQLDFRFIDHDGYPVDDYVFKMGAVVNGENVPSDTVVCTHKNTFTPNHFNAYICLDPLEPQYEYFFELDSESGSYHYRFMPDPLTAVSPPGTITDIIIPDQTTQIEVVLYREPNRKLFVFHPGNDPDLHLDWDRKGNVDPDSTGQEPL